MAEKNLQKSNFDVVTVKGTVKVRSIETYEKDTIKTPFIKFLANKVEKPKVSQKIKTVG